MRRGELQGVSKVVLLRKGEKDALNQFLTFPAFRNTTTSPTRKEGRDPDDWQPRVQAKKKSGSGRLVLSDPTSVALFANTFIVKSKFVVDYLQHL